MRLKEIEKRLAEIRSALESEGADVDALSQEADDLIAEKRKITETAEKRRNVLERIASGVHGAGAPLVTPEPEEPKAEERGNVLAQAEYRSAWLKNIRKLDLTENEKRAFTIASGSAGAAVPTTTVNKIVEAVKQHAPLLTMIDLMHVTGNITIPAEGTTIEAATHKENQTITSDNDKLKVAVTLGGFEVTKLITISKSVDTMTIDAFENWLVNKISRTVAEKIENLILNGTGTSEAQGINQITWNETNSVTTETVTEANILQIIGLLNGGYDKNAVWLMSKNTFWNSFYPLMNKSKNVTIAYENSKWFVGGFEVIMEDRQDGALFGDFYNGYAANMPEDINVVSQFVAKQNGYDILGAAMFDGKVQAIEAFRKLIINKAA